MERLDDVTRVVTPELDREPLEGGVGDEERLVRLLQGIPLEASGHGPDRHREPVVLRLHDECAAVVADIGAGESARSGISVGADGAHGSGRGSPARPARTAASAARTTGRLSPPPFWSITHASPSSGTVMSRAVYPTMPPE